MKSVKCGLKSERVYKQDSVRSYMLCAVGVLCNVITFGTINSFGVIFPVLLHEFKQGEAKTAWLGSLAMALACAFGPVGGFMNRKFGPRLSGIAGALISAMGLFITSQLKHFGAIFLTYGIIFAFGSSLIYTTVFNIVPKYFLRRRSLATGLISLGPGAGVFVMSQTIEVSLNAFGWRGSLLVVGGMIALLVFPIMLFFTLNVEDPTPDANKCGGVWITHAGHSPPPLWKNKRFLIYNIVISLYLFGCYIPQVHMVRYCIDLGINHAMASKLYIGFGIGSMVTRVLTGFFADHPSVNPHYILQFGLFSIGLSTLLCPLAKDFLALMGYFIVFGIFDGFTCTSFNVLALSTARKGQYGQAMGFSMAIMTIGLISGPPLGGFIVEQTGSYEPVFYCAGSVVLLSWMLTFLVFCLGNKDQEETKGQLLKQELLNEYLIIIEQETVL